MTTEVLVLDRPGESLADVRVGGLVVPGDHPDWPALVAVREILADRLAGGPWAFAEFLRVRGPGAFVAGGRMPVDALPGALDRLWTELRTLGDHLVAPEDLRAATAPLAESFRTATAGAPALAEELARAAALGLGPEAVAGYTARLGTLTPDAVRRAAREHLDPARLVIAAEGDGAFLAAELGRFGPVRRIGAPLPPPDWPPLTVDGGRLSPGVLRYRVRIGDREVGSARREILPVDGGRIRVRSTARIGEEEVGQEVHATLPELAFLEGTTIRDGRATASLRREGGRLVGTTPGGTPVELSIPRGTVVSDLLEPTLWASALRVGANHRVPVFGANGTAVTWAGVQVLGEEEVTVPAGTFETLRVRVTGPELLTLWLRRDPPHRTVRLLGANGVILELVGEDRGGG